MEDCTIFSFASASSVNIKSLILVHGGIQIQSVTEYTLDGVTVCSKREIERKTLKRLLLFRDVLD